MTGVANDNPLARYAVHTRTNKAWSLEECCQRYAEAGFGGVGVWREVVEPVGGETAGRMVREAGLRAPSLVRGGFFVSPTQANRDKAIQENLKCVDEAAAVGAEQIVLVVGADPKVPLVDARKQVFEGLSACVDHAAASGVKLAIEPLHPMYAGDKSCVNRMREARLLCEAIGHAIVGIAMDVYHVWWDPDLDEEVRLAGEGGRLFGYHICDWMTPTTDMLNDRGAPGEGCIDLPGITRAVLNAGFDGLIEIEVFSSRHWNEDPSAYLQTLCRSAQQLSAAVTGLAPA
ncbi:MAG: sugar phosphate isomerase/epimerase family protein [Planctomycetota bacterium]